MYAITRNEKNAMRLESIRIGVMMGGGVRTAADGATLEEEAKAETAKKC